MLLLVKLGLGVATSFDAHIEVEVKGYAYFDCDPYSCYWRNFEHQTIIFYEQSPSEVVKHLLLGDTVYSLLLREREREVHPQLHTSPTRPHFLILPKQFHCLEIKYSNMSLWGHFFQTTIPFLIFILFLNVFVQELLFF